MNKINNNLINNMISHVIKDPVHGTMQFTALENNWIKPFIDSPNFQRLRHIKQLGMGDFIFPGAVHTRFNHCLGCCYIASQIANKIGLGEEKRQLVMIACLLHDIGHGPFSHTFEDLFQDKLIRHEAWTPYFLQDYRNPEFFDYYNRCNPHHPLTEEKFQLIEEMIMHKSARKEVIGDIVSSQLDADRLDYLLRDSHFCGVSYGQFDLHWMLNSMVIVNSPHGERLGLTHKGIGVVEHYLSARRLMVRNIYHHHKKLGLEYLLVKLLTTLSASIENYAPFNKIKNSRLGKFLSHANLFNQQLSEEGDISQAKKGFLDTNFSDYKELYDYDIFCLVKFLATMQDPHPAAQIAQRIYYRRMPKIIRFDLAILSSLQTILDDFFSSSHDLFEEWQLTLIKTPHQSYSISEDPIYIMNDQGKVRPVNEISLMINAISDKYEHTTFLCVDYAICEKNEIKKLIELLSKKKPGLSK